MKYVDLTQIIDNDTKVYPGDESFSIKQAAGLEKDGFPLAAQALIAFSSQMSVGSRFTLSWFCPWRC